MTTLFAFLMGGAIFGCWGFGIGAWFMYMRLERREAAAAVKERK